MLWHALGLVISVITGVMLLANYAEIANPVPIHFGFDGEAGGFVTKNYLTVASFPLVAALLTAMLGGSSWALQRGLSPQAVTTSDSSPWSDSVATRAAILVKPLIDLFTWMSPVTAVILNGLALSSMVPGFQWLAQPITALMVIWFVAVLVHAIWGGISATRKAARVEPDEAEDQRRGLKFQLHYRNPQDPHAVLPSQLSSGNVVVNLAHRPARMFWWWIIGPLALLLVFTLILLVT